MPKALKIALLALLCVCAAFLLYLEHGALRRLDEAAAATSAPQPTAVPTPTPAPAVWHDGFTASDGSAVELLSLELAPLRTVARGTALETEEDGDRTQDGRTFRHVRRSDGTEGYIAAGSIADTPDGCVREQTVYVRTATSFYLSPDGLSLDGGRLVFLLVEGVRRKPVPAEKEGMVHAIGLLLLVGLILVITYQDVLRLIAG